MGNVAVNQMQVWEQRYQDIAGLYGLVDELLTTVETAANPTMQMALVEHLAEAIGESADVLADEYIGLCEGIPSRKKSATAKVEGALRKIYVAISDFSTRARDARNAAHAVVKKLKLQLEQIICHFAEMVQMSLDRIMQKHDIDELKNRHANISLMLYSSTQMGKQPI